MLGTNAYEWLHFFPKWESITFHMIKYSISKNTLLRTLCPTCLSQPPLPLKPSLVFNTWSTSKWKHHFLQLQRFFLNMYVISHHVRVCLKSFDIFWWLHAPVNLSFVAHYCTFRKFFILVWNIIPQYCYLYVFILDCQSKCPTTERPPQKII